MKPIRKPEGKKLSWNLEVKDKKGKTECTFILENNDFVYRYDCSMHGPKVKVEVPSDNLPVGTYKATFQVRVGTYIEDIPQGDLQVLDAKKEIKETSQAGDITGAGGGLPNYMDREAAVLPIKYVDGESKNAFMDRCLALETGKRKALSLERAKTICELAWSEFTETEKELSPVQEYEKVKSKFKKITKEILEEEKHEFERMADFILELDPNELTDNQLSDLDKILGSISEETTTGDVAQTTSRVGPSGGEPVKRVQDGKLYTNKTPSIARSKQLAYDRRNSNKIKKKREHIAKTKTVRGQKKERDKKAHNRVGRTAVKGQKQKRYNV